MKLICAKKNIPRQSLVGWLGGWWSAKCKSSHAKGVNMHLGKASESPKAVQMRFMFLCLQKGNEYLLVDVVKVEGVFFSRSSGGLSF